jgi:preprotein translocase subunit SecY
MSGAESFVNIFRIPELKKKVFFTLAVLVVYRIGAHIPTPGINSVALAEIMARMTGTIMGFFDMFSGGALSRLTIFALGIMPYISASIILQLMTMVSPYLARLKKEGEQGQKKITQYTRYGTIPRAKMVNRLSAPPENISKNPMMVPVMRAIISARATELIPGVGI